MKKIKLHYYDDQIKYELTKELLNDKDKEYVYSLHMKNIFRFKLLFYKDESFELLSIFGSCLNYLQEREVPESPLVYFDIPKNIFITIYDTMRDIIEYERFKLTLEQDMVVFESQWVRFEFSKNDLEWLCIIL